MESIEELIEKVEVGELEDGSVELTINFKEDQTPEEAEIIKGHILGLIDRGIEARRKGNEIHR